MGIAKVFLAIGIAIVFAVFIGYGVFVIYEPPRTWEMSNCTMQYYCDKPINECNQRQMNQTLNGSATVSPEYYAKMVPMNEDCWTIIQQTPEYKKCQEDMQLCEDDFSRTTERFRHAKISFYVLIIIGIISIITGIMLSRLEGIGSGIMGGGILIIIWSLIYTAEYWFKLDKYIKLFMLGFVLVLLIYLGYKRLEKQLQPKVTEVPRKKRKAKKKR